MRTIYKGNLWLSPEEAASAVHNGFNFTEPHFNLNHVHTNVAKVSRSCLPVSYVCVLLFPGVAEEAYGASSQISSQKKWALWYLRPKIHMFQHLLFLGCTPNGYMYPKYLSSPPELIKAPNEVPVGARSGVHFESPLPKT